MNKIRNRQKLKKKSVNKQQNIITEKQIFKSSLTFFQYLNHTFRTILSNLQHIAAVQNKNFANFLCLEVQKTLQFISFLSNSEHEPLHAIIFQC